MRRCKILHLIGQLETAGAENVLLQLLQRADRRHFEMEVVELIGGGTLRPKFNAAGIQVSSLGMRRGIADPRALWRLRKLLAAREPHLLVTWMYHSNLIGSLAAGKSMPVVWNIHNTQLDGPGARPMTRWVSRACAFISSGRPRQIVYVSRESRRVHERTGYEPSTGLVIPNGFDTAHFAPDAAARTSLRAELGIPDGALIVGHAGRFHPHKDHRNLIEAARIVLNHRPATHFVLCGRGVDQHNALLGDWLMAAGLKRHCHLLGQRDDMPRLQAAFDIGLSASASEAFPLAVGEAMASGTPCVVTDVGDSAVLVGETGEVAPPRNSTALARSILKMLALPAAARCRLGHEARHRVAQHFEIGVIGERYYRLWSELAGEPKHTLEPDASPIQRAA